MTSGPRNQPPRAEDRLWDRVDREFRRLRSDPALSAAYDREFREFERLSDALEDERNSR